MTPPSVMYRYPVYARRQRRCSADRIICGMRSAWRFTTPMIQTDDHFLRVSFLQLHNNNNNNSILITINSTQAAYVCTTMTNSGIMNCVNSTLQMYANMRYIVKRSSGEKYATLQRNPDIAIKYPEIQTTAKNKCRSSEKPNSGNNG